MKAFTRTAIIWEAWIMYDPSTGQRIGVYASRDEAKRDCPGWRDEGYVIAPCEIHLVKGPKT